MKLIRKLKFAKSIFTLLYVLLYAIATYSIIDGNYCTNIKSGNLEIAQSRTNRDGGLVSTTPLSRRAFIVHLSRELLNENNRY